MTGPLLLALSVVAGLGTALMLVPQLLRTWRQGVTGDVAPGLFVLSGVGNVLWLAYAWQRGEWALFGVAVLAALLAAWQLWLVWRKRT